MNTATAMAPAPIIDRPNISWETWNFMRQEIARLVAEKAQLQADVTHWEQQTNHWYMKATYTDLERQIMYRRRSRGANELTGEWEPAAHQRDAAA
jgi:hypothetical protein